MITDFEVTYGSALAANKFHRVVGATGAAANINTGARRGGKRVTGSRGPPAACLVLAHDRLACVPAPPFPLPAAPPPPLSPLTGAGSPVYLWYKNGDEGAIVGVRILHDDEAVPDGWVKVAKDLLVASEGHAYVCFKRFAEGDTALPIVDLRLLPTSATGACGGALRGASACAPPVLLLVHTVLVWGEGRREGEGKGGRCEVVGVMA